MKKPILAILASILASLACGTYITPTPAPVLPIETSSAVASTTPVPEKKQGVTATYTPTETKIPSLTITGTVYIRNTPNGEIVGHLDAGEIVSGVCAEDWCSVSADTLTGYIWRGCTSEAGTLGCERR